MLFHTERLLDLSPLALALLLGLAARLAGCGGEPEPDVYGNFEATETAVSAQAEGRLVQFAVDEGDRLAAGETVGTVETAQLASQRDALLAQRQNLAAVRVDVRGARGTDGRIVVALFADRTAFPLEIEHADYSASAPVVSGQASVFVSGVEAGSYAVVAVHDADADGLVQTGLFGMPREGVAIINWTGGIPRFDRAQLQLAPGDTLRFSLSLRYP